MFFATGLTVVLVGVGIGILKKPTALGQLKPQVGAVTVLLEWILSGKQKKTGHVSFTSFLDFSHDFFGMLHGAMLGELFPGMFHDVPC